MKTENVTVSNISFIQKLYYTTFRRKQLPQPINNLAALPIHDREVQLRYLKAQLSNAHDRGSRTQDNIALHAQWIHKEILKSKPSRLIDLGCGPGLYSHQLAKYFHYCYGIDISKPAINYAKQYAIDNDLSGKFICANFLEAEFTINNDAVLMLYSIFNQLSFDKVQKLLIKIYQSLKPNGLFYLEAMDFIIPGSVYTTSWYTANSDDFFSDRKHLCLMERFWEAEQQQIQDRFIIIDFERHEIQEYINALYLYTKEQYHHILNLAGFSEIYFIAPPPGTHQGDDKAYISIIAKK